MCISEDTKARRSLDQKNQPTDRCREAIVIGGSLAGLMTARVLSKHFDRVVILERDSVSAEPQFRKGQPQTRHTHVLLAKGLEVMKSYFPDLQEGLERKGVEFIDFAKEARWYLSSGMIKPFESRLPYVMASRPLLEAEIRRRVLELENVEMIDECKTQSLIADAHNERILGVRVEIRSGEKRIENLFADLVVDASGRGSQVPKWLRQLGYESPREEKVDIGIGYATRVYRRQEGQLADGRMVVVTPNRSDERRGGCLVPMEGDRWICTLSGCGGEQASTDENEFMDYAKSLLTPAIADTLEKLEPISDIITYKYPHSLRRHYHKLKRFPTGLLVLGDAHCSFNPVYGQGMTSACMQAQELDRALARNRDSKRLWKVFFKNAAKYVGRAWQLAALGDFQFSSTTGDKPLGADAMNAYVARIHEAAQRDSVVYHAFLLATNLVASPWQLFRPSIVARVVIGSTRVRLARTRCVENPTPEIKEEEAVVSSCTV